MTASALLADLCDRGVRLRLSEDRLRILIPRAVLTPDLRASLLSVKPQLIRMIELAEQYRQLLRDGVADEDGVEGRRRFAEHQARLVDELGPKLAGAIGAMESRREEEDGTCPRCEGRGQCQECGNTPES